MKIDQVMSWLQRIATVALIAAIIFIFINEFEKRKLNQQYTVQVEQMKVGSEILLEISNRWSEQVSSHDLIIQGFQDLQDQMVDRLDSLRTE